MIAWIEWLLGLDNIRLGRDAPLALRWDLPFPAWTLMALTIAAVTWIVVVYRRERGSVFRRSIPAGIRTALVLLVVVMICRPSLVLQRNRTEPSQVVLALDASLSMANTDSYVDRTLLNAVMLGAGINHQDELRQRSRLDLVRAALIKNDASPLRRMFDHNGVQLCSFARTLEPLGYYSTSDRLGELEQRIHDVSADGTGTDLANAIQSIFARSSDRRLSAVVIATDGRATADSGLNRALETARDRQIPIFPIRIGSPAPLPDVILSQALTEENVFVDDYLTVEAHITSQGLATGQDTVVSLVDNETNRLLASQEVHLDAETSSVTVELRTKPSGVGLVRYRVEVKPLATEQVLGNNSKVVQVTVLKKKLHVLYVEGYPRYEYRYLKNALVREPTLEVSILLIEADERFIQEGTDPVRRFPETPEELRRYDVVLFGDVNPMGGWLSVAQMRMLLDFVGNEGGGFGLIAGERFAPQRFAGTELEKLIPVHIDASINTRSGRALTSGFAGRLTHEGRRGRLFRFLPDREQNARYMAKLPELYWFASTDGPRAGASVLFEHPIASSLQGALPLVVTGRYGAGKLFFQATDDTWRWRRHTGELFHDTYWVHVIRELMRPSRVFQDRRYTLRTDRRVYGYGDPVRVSVDLLDQRLLGQTSDKLSVAVTTTRSSVGIDSTDLPTSQVAARFTVHRLGPESNAFEGSWIPRRPGGFTLSLPDIATRSDNAESTTMIQVELPDIEGQQREADHDALMLIAEVTGGRVLDLDELETAFVTLPDRSVQTPDDVVEPLWDSRLAFGLFVLLITMEWTLRKIFGLL